MAHYAPMVAMKLVAHPLLVLGAGSLAMSSGLPLDEFALTALVLAAALPSASNVSPAGRALPRRQRPHRAHHPVVTALAFLSFSLTVRLMGAKAIA